MRKIFILAALATLLLGCGSGSDGEGIAPGSNVAPKLDSIGPQSVDEGQALTFTVNATDPNEGQTLTYSAGNLPTGAGFDPDTRTFTWTPTHEQASNYPAVVFSVMDDGTPPLGDSEAIAITVGDVNRPPVLDPIGPQGVSEGETLSFTVTASDPDTGQALTLSASNLPTGSTFDPGAFTWPTTFEDAGTYPNVLFTVTDDGAPPASDSEAVTITIGDVNRPPELMPIGSREILENEPLTIALTATDPDVGQVLTCTAANLPPGATFDAPTATFNWTPGYDQAGPWAVLFTVLDNGSPVESDFEEVTITVGDVNRPPVLAPIGAKTGQESAELSFTVTASDPDGDNVTVTAAPLPPGATFDGQTFDWTPGYDQSGNYTVTFLAEDDGVPVESDFEDVTTTIGNVNRPPVLNPIADRTVNEGEALTITLVANDPDNDPLSYLADLPGLPPEAVFDPGAQTLTWTPTYNDAGTYPGLTFSVTDGGLSDSETITIAVIDVNAAPVLTNPGNQSIPEGSALSLTLMAVDPDGDPVTYGTVDPLPPGATLDPNTGDFAWTPGFDQAGDHPVTFTASDGLLTDSQPVTITVTETNQAPVLDPIGDQSVQRRVLLTFTVTASDPDPGQTVTLTMESPTLPPEATFDSGTGTFSWTPAPGDLARSPYTATFTATDDGTPPMSTQETMTITVTK